jgi:hypothetical protein
MTYQISEKNQILIALFAIVVLCAGKLFKDYLFRKGYVEGMTGNFILSVVADVPLSRPAANAVDKTFNLYFKIKMPAATSDITVELPNDRSSDITLSATDTDYTLYSVNASTGELTAVTLASSNGKVYTVANSSSQPPVPRKIEFKANPQISINDIIQIGIKGIIKPKNQPTGNDPFGPFKVIIGGVDDARTIQITPNSGGSSTAATTSAIEIQNAINSIQTQLNTMGSSAAGRTQLLNAQSALVTVMAYTYGTVKEAGKVFDSEALYEAQRTAMEFIDKEKKRAASNATALKEDNSNKRRMAQVNTYYTRNYEANTEVMKNIIFISVALIILAILRNKELIPDSISTLGIIFVLMLGGVVIGSQVFDIIRRNDHDFDKYDWTFNEKEQNDKKFIQTDTANLSELGMGMAPCFGSSCCDSGTRWDETAKKCIPLTGSVSGTARWTAAAGGTLTIRLTVPTALAVSDTVTINLPSGVFSGTNLAVSSASSGFTLAGGSTVSAPLIFTKTTSGINAGDPASIVITGLSVTPGASALMKDLTVKTSKDINYVRIGITGI